MTTYTNETYAKHYPQLVAQAVAAGYVAEDDPTDVDVVEYIKSEHVDAFKAYADCGLSDAEAVELLSEYDCDYDEALRGGEVQPHDPYAHVSF
jgi:hypothetical protein